MAAHELNFKYLSSDKYRLYRLMQTPSVMGAAYRERIKRAGNYRGAIIFPEQFISLYGQSIARVVVQREHDSLAMGVVMHEHFTLCGKDKPYAFTTLQHVQDLEDEYASADVSSLFGLRFDSPSSGVFKSTMSLEWKAGEEAYWFSNKAAAFSFIEKNLFFS